MYARSFGATRVPVPVIGQGTWHIDGSDRADAIRALRAGIDAGMTHIDTAEMYGDAEAIVAEAIADCREEVFLVSKVVPGNATRRGVVRACEASLQRLRTDHWTATCCTGRASIPWRRRSPASRTSAGTGKILVLGLSNFDVADLDRVLAIAGPDRIACNQVLYHLNERAIEHAVLPWCERHGVAMVGYSPFGSGEFPDPASPGGGVSGGIAQRPRHHALRGGPGVPDPPAGDLHDPEDWPARPGRRECRGGGSASRDGRDRPDRRAFPAGPATAHAAHAVRRRRIRPAVPGPRVGRAGRPGRGCGQPSSPRRGRRRPR